MSDNEDSNNEIEMTDEEQEHQHHLILETADRLADLSMALCYYDDILAKQALAIALTRIFSQFDEEPPTLDEVMNLADHVVNHDHEHDDDSEDGGSTENN